MSSCNRTKVGSRPDFRDGDAGSTEIRWAAAVERISKEGCNFENEIYIIMA